jgi:hypothetical protein
MSFKSASFEADIFAEEIAQDNSTSPLLNSKTLSNSTFILFVSILNPYQIEI